MRTRLPCAVISRQPSNHPVVYQRKGARSSWIRIPLRQLHFVTLAILFTPICQCLSEETLKAVSPFYLVSMPGVVKDPPVCTGNV